MGRAPTDVEERLGVEGGGPRQGAGEKRINCPVGIFLPEDKS